MACSPRTASAGGSRSHPGGQGDSAIYIGQTPVQKKPKWTSIDHDLMYENVLGYSGTNSKYVDINHNDAFNNGIGLVPNTLESELFEPTGHGRIRNNDIFWNNFNYFLPKSPVQTVSNGLGTFMGKTINYPTGVGVAIFGGDGWKITHNRIFGNFRWGGALFSDFSNTAALSENNVFKNNQMGRNGTDPNGADFFTDGSGKGNCFADNGSGVTYDNAGGATNASLYPSCPAPAPPTSGTGTVNGEPKQFGELAGYVLSTPPCKQQDQWTRHKHPKFKKFKPIDAKNLGPCS
jgi:hypothetical protein